MSAGAARCASGFAGRNAVDAQRTTFERLAGHIEKASERNSVIERDAPRIHGGRDVDPVYNAYVLAAPVVAGETDCQIAHVLVSRPGDARFECRHASPFSDTGL